MTEKLKVVQSVKIWSVVHYPEDEESDDGEFIRNAGMDHEGIADEIAQWEQDCRDLGFSPRVVVVPSGHAVYFMGRAEPQDQHLAERVKELEDQLRELLSFVQNIESNVSRLAGVIQSMMDSRIVRP